jgi:ATP-dependent DNA helicase RecG
MKDILNRLLTATVETEVLEFKEAKNTYSKDKLGQYFSALGNEANLRGRSCAYLLFGVRNDRTVVGTSISDAQLNEFKKEMADHTSPRLSFLEVHRVTHPHGEVLIFEIPSAPKGFPIAWKGHRYGRDGESLGGLNDKEYEIIRTQAHREDWSKAILAEATLADLDPEAIIRARIEFAEKNPKLIHEIQSWDDIVFLNKARVTIKGAITRTAILLLGKAESDHFLNPATSRISWILKDKDNLEKDYQHFGCPLILEVEKLYSKIRNLKYRYLQEGSLFPDEVDQFDPFIIREALNNCIAHQDYTKAGKINVVEHEDGKLTFINSGSFIPGDVEKVIESDAPENVYRNPFLASAMVSLNMIDTTGSGIKRMFIIQKDKYFPLPEYDLSNEKVKVQIIGKVIDVNYARKLAHMKELSLNEIIMLDKVAKRKPLTSNELLYLRSKELIEGRKPNLYISSKVATATDDKAAYIKQRGIDDIYCQKIITDYLMKFGEGRKSDFEKILLDKLPDVLDIYQKRNKIKNNLQVLKKKGVIVNLGKFWKMSKG